MDEDAGNANRPREGAGVAGVSRLRGSISGKSDYARFFRISFSLIQTISASSIDSSMRVSL